MTDDQLNEPISQYTHERDMARLERIIHLLIILCMIMFIAFVTFIVIVARYESQFCDGVTYEELASEYDLHVNTIKKIIYKNEWKIFKHLDVKA